MSSGESPETRSATPGQEPVGRAYIGLGILGWGVSILLQLAPHEDPVVGAGLAVFGAALLATAPRRPRIQRLPAVVVGVLGLAAAAGVLTFNALTDASLNLPKTAIVVLGLGLALLAPFLGTRTARSPAGAVAATVAACSIAVLAMPLALWGLQAGFERALGATPVEAFIHFGILLPMAAALTLFGWNPTVTGQNIQYATPRGELNVEVGAACSGVEAMALFAGVLALYLIKERPRGPQLGAWAAVGLLGVYAANVVRLIFLATIGYQWGIEALLATHAHAGWIFFVGWAVLFAFLVRGYERRRAHGREPPVERRSPRARATGAVGTPNQDSRLV